MKTEDSGKGKYSAVKNFLFRPGKDLSPSVIEYSSLGFQIALTILVFLFIGIWLDKKLETKFIFTLIFTFLGFVGVFYKIIITVKELDRRKNELKKDK
ncbi:MAG: AtpZ/AtpI family protein [Ignavibacteria bacterium]|nr:AtpZ/AtpI family protein [Ignavibacteria bacterium]